MKKIVDLPNDAKLGEIKVKLPEAIIKVANEFGGFPISDFYYIVGPMMGDWFVSLEPKSVGNRRVHPLFREFIPWDEIKEWEVVE